MTIFCLSFSHSSHHPHFPHNYSFSPWIHHIILITSASTIRHPLGYQLEVIHSSCDRQRSSTLYASDIGHPLFMCQTQVIHSSCDRQRSSTLHVTVVLGVLFRLLDFWIAVVRRLWVRNTQNQTMKVYFILIRTTQKYAQGTWLEFLKIVSK